MKKKVREFAFSQLEENKLEHEKVRDIMHSNNDQVQEYLKTHKMTNRKKSLLFNLRSKSENTFKDNFHRMYNDVSCPMLHYLWVKLERIWTVFIGQRVILSA